MLNMASINSYVIFNQQRTKTGQKPLDQLTYAMTIYKKSYQAVATEKKVK